jgi:hypothetical protein
MALSDFDRTVLMRRLAKYNHTRLAACFAAGALLAALTIGVASEPSFSDIEHPWLGLLIYFVGTGIFAAYVYTWPGPHELLGEKKDE